MDEVRKFNFDKLEKELQDVVSQEKQYWLENDAKIRAVKQGVPSYDHFRELVMGAHLKPLEKGEQLDAFTKSRNQPWNVSFSPGAQGSSQSASDTQLGDSYQTIDLPLNHAQFNLIWKRCCQDESSRYQFLLRYVNEGVDLSSVFKTDLPSAIFTQCIAAVNECFCTDDQNSIIAILTALTQSKRFKLALKFLSKSEKDVLADLIDKLDEDKVSSSQLDQHYKEALD